jgi:hypothetical protein
MSSTTSPNRRIAGFNPLARFSGGRIGPKIDERNPPSTFRRPENVDRATAISRAALLRSPPDRGSLAALPVPRATSSALGSYEHQGLNGDQASR